MAKKLIIFFSVVCLLFIITGCSQKYTGEPADLVIKNAKILTINNENPRAEAVAMKGKKLDKDFFRSLIQKYYKVRGWNEKGKPVQ